MHVVILAYGPSQRTKNTVRRAHKLAGSGHQVLVVAASPVGRDAVASLPGVTAVSEQGGAGIRSALSLLPDEPTVLMHDDVTITAKGVVALERELQAGSRYVVPYSNDPGMDHFIGSLPADKAAQRHLDQLPVPAESKIAIRIRPACVAGNAGDLMKLLSHPVADPFASINSGEFTFTVAAGALASHSTTCVGRLVTEPAVERPLVVAALIVRDEVEMLPGCLASLDGVVDRVEVCDTGSVDGTIELARELGANVIEREWTNDFGAARNEVLEQCRDARYVLWIDADERLVCPNPDEARRYLATYAAEHASFNIEITNLESDGSELYRFTTIRLFHGSGTEFRGALHEAVHHVGETRPLNGHRLGQMRIDHHGYAHDVVAARNKAQRNLEIAEAQHDAEGDARSAIHLARSLSYADETPERAISLLEESLEGADNDTTRGQVKGLIADRYLEMTENRTAFDTAREALELLPGDDTALGILTKASERLGNPEEFLTVAEEYADRTSGPLAVTIEHNRMVYRDYLIRAYANVGEAEKAVAEAFALLEADPAAFTNWPDLITCLSDGFGVSALELLLPLTLKDSVGGFFEPLIRTYPSALVADFCAAYLAAGGAITEAVRVGLLAAAMANNDGAFEAIRPMASDLDPFVRVGLADRIATSGRTDLADKLRAEPVVLKL
jgi:tetratricopeptide (TPR) repeat protein